MPTYTPPWNAPLPAGMPTVSYTDSPEGRTWTAAGIAGEFSSLRDLVGAWNVISLGAPNIEPPHVEGNVVSSPTDPGLTEPGFWIQTGLGPGGLNKTLWYEDGS